MGRGHRTIRSGDQTSLKAGNRAGKRQLIMSPIVVKTGEQAFLIAQSRAEGDVALKQVSEGEYVDIKRTSFTDLPESLKRRYLRGAQVAHDAVLKISKGKGFQSLKPAEKEKAAAAVCDALSKDYSRRRSYQHLSESKKEEFREFIEAVGRVEHKPADMASAKATSVSQADKKANDLALLKKLMASLKKDGYFYIGDNKVSGEQAKNYLRALNQKIKAEKAVA